MIVVQAMVVINLGDSAFNISGQTAGSILPSDPIVVLGTRVPRDRFYLAALTVVIGVALWAVFRYTTFGLATRGAAESEKGAAVCGYSSTRLGAINWMVGHRARRLRRDPDHPDLRPQPDIVHALHRSRARCRPPGSHDLVLGDARGRARDRHAAVADDEARLGVRLVAEKRPAGGPSLHRDHRGARRVRPVDPVERHADRSRHAGRRASEASRALGRALPRRGHRRALHARQHPSARAHPEPHRDRARPVARRGDRIRGPDLARRRWPSPASAASCTGS